MPAKAKQTIVLIKKAQAERKVSEFVPKLTSAMATHDIKAIKDVFQSLKNMSDRPLATTLLESAERLLLKNPNPSPDLFAAFLEGGLDIRARGSVFIAYSTKSLTVKLIGSRFLGQVLLNDNLELFKLLQNHIDIAKWNGSVVGENALIFALQHPPNPNYFIVQHLIQNNLVDINEVDNNGYSAFSKAISRGNKIITEMIFNSEKFNKENLALLQVDPHEVYEKLEFLRKDMCFSFNAAAKIRKMLNAWESLSKENSNEMNTDFNAKIIHSISMLNVFAYEDDCFHYNFPPFYTGRILGTTCKINIKTKYSEKEILTLINVARTHYLNNSKINLEYLWMNVIISSQADIKHFRDVFKQHEFTVNGLTHLPWNIAPTQIEIHSIVESALKNYPKIKDRKSIIEKLKLYIDKLILIKLIPMEGKTKMFKGHSQGIPKLNTVLSLKVDQKPYEISYDDLSCFIEDVYKFASENAGDMEIFMSHTFVQYLKEFQDEVNIIDKKRSRDDLEKLKVSLNIFINNSNQLSANAKGYEDSIIALKGKLLGNKTPLNDLPLSGEKDKCLKQNLDYTNILEKVLTAIKLYQADTVSFISSCHTEIKKIAEVLSAVERANEKVSGWDYERSMTMIDGDGVEISGVLSINAEHVLPVDEVEKLISSGDALADKFKILNLKQSQVLRDSIGKCELYVEKQVKNVAHLKRKHMTELKAEQAVNANQKEQALSLQITKSNAQTQQDILISNKENHKKEFSKKLKEDKATNLAKKQLAKDEELADQENKQFLDRLQMALSDLTVSSYLKKPKPLTFAEVTDVVPKVTTTEATQPIVKLLQLVRSCNAKDDADRPGELYRNILVERSALLCLFARLMEDVKGFKQTAIFSAEHAEKIRNVIFHYGNVFFKELDPSIDFNTAKIDFDVYLKANNAIRAMITKVIEFMQNENAQKKCKGNCEHILAEIRTPLLDDILKFIETPRQDLKQILEQLTRAQSKLKKFKDRLEANNALDNPDALKQAIYFVYAELGACAADLKRHHPKEFGDRNANNKQAYSLAIEYGNAIRHGRIPNIEFREELPTALLTSVASRQLSISTIASGASISTSLSTMKDNVTKWLFYS